MVKWDPPSMRISFGTPKNDTHSPERTSLDVVFRAEYSPTYLEKLSNITIMKEFPNLSSFNKPSGPDYKNIQTIKMIHRVLPIQLELQLNFWHRWPTIGYDTRHCDHRPQGCFSNPTAPFSSSDSMSPGISASIMPFLRMFHKHKWLHGV